MKTIHVLKAFVLTLEDQTRRVFAKGLHEVEESVASHWYVQAHSEPVAAAAAVPTDAEAEAAKAIAQIEAEKQKADEELAALKAAAEAEAEAEALAAGKKPAKK